MTNRNMTRQTPSAVAMPEPNPAAPRPVPAPESEPPGRVLHDPMDSPQPKPMINQGKSGGLKEERPIRKA